MGNTNGKPVVFTDQGQSSIKHFPNQRAMMGSARGSLTLVDVIVNLNHFRLLRVVGKGAFGKVRIVERKDTGLTFALKYIRKDESQHCRRKQYRRVST